MFAPMKRTTWSLFRSLICTPSARHSSTPHNAHLSHCALPATETAGRRSGTGLGAGRGAGGGEVRAAHAPSTNLRHKNL